MEFLIVIVVAVVVEGVVTYVKAAFPKLYNKNGILFLITAGLGIAAAVGYHADIFAILGFDSRIPWLGEILTGILCGRGANYMYTLIGKLSGAMQELDDIAREAKRYEDMMRAQNTEMLEESPFELYGHETGNPQVNDGDLNYVGQG